ncbi:hypothetical protein [Nitrobacter sp. JJSN]|uniref:hypothetical protein n=1 Tax=Nitrobacter sp. JJSN TaxID=3453033 RepID=UPI003F75C7C6
MTTSQEEADELLREWQERRRSSIAAERRLDELFREWQIAAERRLDLKRGKINDGEVTIRRVEVGFALFVWFASLREELRARTGVHSTAPQPASNPQAPLFVGTRAKPLPRYAERDRNGRVWFRVDRCARVQLPKDPTTPEFRAAYNAALVEAAASEPDHDDWSELEAMHRAQRRGTAKHGGQR